MNKKDFNNISIRGRVAYCIACFKAYVLNKYPRVDFSPVSAQMWSIVGDGENIDVSAEKYMEIVPEYLFEADSYEDSDFEYLTEDDYQKLICILNKDDSALNLIMHRIYDIAMEYAYEALEAPGKQTIDYVFNVIDELKDCNVPVPPIERYKEYSFERNDGWGVFIDPID